MRALSGKLPHGSWASQVWSSGGAIDHCKSVDVLCSRIQWEWIAVAAGSVSLCDAGYRCSCRSQSYSTVCDALLSWVKNETGKDGQVEQR